MTVWARRLRAAARLAASWHIFKVALDDALADPVVRRRIETVLTGDPVLAAHFAILKALWMPVERDLKELR